MKRTLMYTLAAAAIAVSLPLAAQAQIADDDFDPEAPPVLVAGELHGSYRQVNDKLADTIVSFEFPGQNFYLGLGGLYDVVAGYEGKASNVVLGDGSVSFDCTLISGIYDENLKPIPAHITLTRLPSGLYELQTRFDQRPTDGLALIEGTTTLYKTDDYRIQGTVPAKTGKKLSVAGLFLAAAPYDFRPETMATVWYLRNRDGLAEHETVVQDEKNRFLQYAWGAEDLAMECKYWPMADGNVLLVMNYHDQTYQYPQLLRFLVFDTAKGTVTELPTAFSDKWPLATWEQDNGGICYQVRYESDGIVALVPQTNGDSVDLVTLKFDGKIFK